MKKVGFLFTQVIPVFFKYVVAYFLTAVSCRKCSDQLWLISERGVDARDNGYFFFKYLRDNQPQIRCCYVISSRSADFQKVANIGETVELGSIQHYMMLIRAKCLISSHIMGFTPNPEVFLILERRKLITLPGKKVFLQHGITKDNINGLKYPNVKLDLFVSGASAEYVYLRENYKHPENVVQLTGLARYDTLDNKEMCRQILLMPTWRKWLNDCSEDQFLRTDYYRAFHKLLSDSQIQQWLRKNNMTLVFYPHYEMQKYIGLFEKLQCDVICIAKFAEYDVQTLLKQSCLLITDYSSVYFDFSFLRKPILFYQFDKEQFFEQHYHRGYFDEHTFGVVATTHEEVKGNVFSLYCADYFVNDYIDDQSAFFGDFKAGCCARIYQAIQKILRESNDS